MQLKAVLVVVRCSLFDVGDVLRSDAVPLLECIQRRLLEDDRLLAQVLQHEPTQVADVVPRKHLLEPETRLERSRMERSKVQLHSRERATVVRVLVDDVIELGFDEVQTSVVAERAALDVDNHLQDVVIFLRNCSTQIRHIAPRPIFLFLRWK